MAQQWRNQNLSNATALSLLPLPPGPRELPVLGSITKIARDTHMSEHASPAPQYTMGYSAEFLQMLDRRNAQTHAAYLLPHLRSGMRVLDFGCGPGTITVGLAAAVQPGERDALLNSGSY